MRRRRLRTADCAAILSLVAFVVIESWGQFAGAQRAIGGDKSAFTLGLMADYADQLASGQIPYWNGRWGFGFAALAESQIGAFYPPHLVLFSTLPIVEAFEWNYLLHRLLVPLAAYLAARTLTLRPLGAWIAALVYSQGGFAVIHLDHIWSVESMVWFPPIIALTFSWLRGGRWRTLALLPPTLAIQLSIGHFQIAFMTMVTATLVVGMGFTGGARRQMWRAAGWLFAVMLGFGLAAAQLLPTYDLQRHLRSSGSLAEDYLSTHAVPPWFLPLPFLPYLYAREPLWRAVVWTPARTAPEEYLPFVGLAPLALALLGATRWRRQPMVRIALVLFLFATALSLGPYLPGQEWLGRLPGFGYFRAAARWTLVAQFAVGLVAGFGADRLRRVEPWRRAWGWLTAGTLLLALTSIAFWAVMDHAARNAINPPPWLSSLIDAGFPWESNDVARKMVQNLGQERTWDEETWTAWERIGRADGSVRLIDRWLEVARLELLPTLFVQGIGWVAIFLSRGWRGTPREARAVRATILLLCLVDFAWLHALYPENVAHTRALGAKDVVLDRLVDFPQGTRVLAPGGNLMMHWGLAPIRAYRTLDVPPPTPLARRLNELERDFPKPRLDPPASTDALIGLGAMLRYPLLTPTGRAEPDWGPGSVVGDGRVIGLWIFGSTRFRQVLEERGLRVQAGLARFERKMAPALIVASDELTGSPTRGYGGLYDRGDTSVAGTAALEVSDFKSRSWKITCTGPAVAVLGELYLPGWHARIETSGRTIDQAVVPVEGFWQGVALPEAGDYLVRLEFTPPGFITGALLSAGSLVVYAGWLVRLALGTRKVAQATGTIKTGSGPAETHGSDSSSAPRG